MKIGTSNIMGIAIGDREIACVQIAGGGPGRRRRARAARFDVPEGLSFAKPEELGLALKSFLASERLGAQRAIVGLPARWLIAEPRELPPTDREQALASLRLQAERISLGDDAKLIFDAAGTLGGSRPVHALLVGISQERLEGVRRFCASAGLTPVAVTATGLVVASALKDRQPEAERAVILFSHEGAELVWSSQAGPRAFRHLSGVRSVIAGGANASLQPLTAELWRAMALKSGAGSAGGRGGSVVLLGDSGFTPEDCQELSGRLGREVECTDGLRALHHIPAAASLNGQADQVATERLWPAVALAGAGMRPTGELPVNFLKPRLAPPRESRWNRTWTLGVAAAAVVVGAIGFLWWSTVAAEAEMAQLQGELDKMSEQVEVAETYVDRFNYARGYFESRPPILDGMGGLAAFFGPEDQIWTTQFTMRENGRVTLQGRAADQRSVLVLSDRLMASGKFANVQVQDMREATRGGSGRGGPTEIGFTLNFTYLGAVPAPAEEEGVQR